MAGAVDDADHGGRLLKDRKDECARLLLENAQRHWLRTHGKNEFIDFDDEERRMLKGYFSSMASDGSGSIGIQELEEALVAFGLAENRHDVQRLMSAVDDDGSGLIEFNEFLAIVRDGYNDAICHVFKQMMAGQLGDKNLSFSMLASTYRRRMLLDAMMAPAGAPSQERGKRIMRAFATQMREYKKRTVEEKRAAMQKKAQYRKQQRARSGGMAKSSSTPLLARAPMLNDVEPPPRGS